MKRELSATPTIVPIVEGHGDQRAIRPLIERVVNAYCSSGAVHVVRARRIQRDQPIKPEALENAAALARRQVGSGDGGVLILIDADDDCPRELGPHLLERARGATGGTAVAVVLAEREFEAWGLAAARSLRGWRGLPSDLEPPANPQSVRGAKEWLTERMAGAAAYSPTADQASLAATIDLREARTAPSFDKFCRAVCSLAAGSGS